MLTIPTSFYAEWRMLCGVAPLLRDDFDSPPERLLQAVWLHQRLLRDQLCTLDGTPVRVLHPGFHNLEGGPDFRAAVIQFGDESPRTGDVEVDLRSSGWHAHGHDRNPTFEKVILHVVWETERPVAGAPPVLLLRQALDAPLGELSLWLGSEASEAFPENLRGRCCSLLRTFAPTQLNALLQEAAHVRLQSKAAQLQARARQAGWNQALWEGLFRALGYKHNVWPMQRLAELRPRWFEAQSDALALQARLLGISSLLPQELTRSSAGADGYLRQVWDRWWRERDQFADCILPRSLWRFNGLRPANHPQRRLALASRWSVEGKLIAEFEKWCRQATKPVRQTTRNLRPLSGEPTAGAQISDQQAPGEKDKGIKSVRSMNARGLATSLLERLHVEPDDFWSWHCTFNSARFKKAQPLLGSGRVSDLAVNVVLPWLWIRAVEGKNTAMQKVIEERYFAWPAAEDNSLLRLARQRLLGGASARVFTGAAAQQGLIQIVRDYCEHSNSVCDNCAFPELLREWRQQPERRPTPVLSRLN